MTRPSSSCGSIRIDRLDPWLGPDRKGASDWADEVTLSRKGAKSPTRGRKLRSTGTKARAHVSDGPNSLIELKKQLEARTRELAEAQKHLAEALEQQAASSEILSAISSSPGELAPVFDTILKNAMRLCKAEMGHILRAEAGALHVTAMRGAQPGYAAFLRKRGPWRPAPHGAPAIAMKKKKPVQLADLSLESGYAGGDRATVAAVELGGVRTVLFVPMIRDDDAIGVIAMYRCEVRPFTQKHIDLVTNFAKQAVIAIEDTRLLNELRQRTDDLSEALEQQTATSEVLGVISSSPGDLQPVFQAMLETLYAFARRSSVTCSSSKATAAVGRQASVPPRSLPNTLHRLRRFDRLLVN
jgi:hypothetical protein